MNRQTYEHKSGAQKRKERKIREANERRGQRTLDQFRLRADATVEDSDVTFCQESVEDRESGEKTTTSHVQITNKPVVTGIEARDEEHDGHLESDESETNVRPFDIGNINSLHMTSAQVENAVRQGPQPHPLHFPDDASGHRFPEVVLHTSLTNGEKVKRDWLVWSKFRQALFCFPCRLFSKMAENTKSALTNPSGFCRENKWKKLHDRIPEHENSQHHRACYIEWRQCEMRYRIGSSVDSLLQENIKNEVDRWKDILRRILDVILFLGERGLAFRGSGSLIGDPKNGNFLGILELISHYDPIMCAHLEKVKQLQVNKARLQAHYLSPETQNEFIDCCATQVVRAIENEREIVKYYSIIVDATPDSAHIEQTVFILRYVLLNEKSGQYEIQERFLEFVDCNSKTGEDIAELIRATLKKHNIPLMDCRGQGYDNASNMSGRYKGVQSHLLRDNSLATFSPCGLHSLNLSGVQAAECCPEVITFFGSIQKLYNIFSSSPQRWSILKNNIGCSLHSMSTTRWSARVDCVKPFAAHMPGLLKAIDDISCLNLTPETRTDLQGLKTYMKSFECTLLASIWFKVLTAINHRNLVLQARNATLDVETANIKSLIGELKTLRDQWPVILRECEIVAVNGNFSDTFQEKRRKMRKRQFDESTPDVAIPTPEIQFKQGVFYVLLDCLIGNMTRRFDALNAIEVKFGFFWRYRELNQQDLRQQARSFCETYHGDVSIDLIEEIIHLKAIHEANLGPDILPPLQLLNELHKVKMEVLFPNICISLRIYCSIPVSVAEGERSFSLLARIKNFLRSTMSQKRLTNLGTLALESGLARNLDFNAIISMFAEQKARKVFLD